MQYLICNCLKIRNSPPESLERGPSSFFSLKAAFSVSKGLSIESKKRIIHCESWICQLLSSSFCGFSDWNNHFLCHICISHNIPYYKVSIFLIDYRILKNNIPYHASPPRSVVVKKIFPRETIIHTKCVYFSTHQYSVSRWQKTFFAWNFASPKKAYKNVGIISKRWVN